MNDKLNKIDILEERISNWMEETKRYRQMQCDKMSQILDKMTNLKCDVHNERVSNFGAEIKVLWGFISAIVLLVISGIIKVFIFK